MSGLAVVETHPVQYHAPVYRAVQQNAGIPVTAIYGSDFSVAGYHDTEFKTEFAWDSDLLSGYESVFLSRVRSGGARDFANVSSAGMGAALDLVAPHALLLTGYSPAFYRKAALLAMRQRMPMMLRAETTDHGPRRATPKRVARDALLRQLYKRCDGLLYIGQRSREHYERLGVDGDRLFFAPYCVDDAPFRCTESDRSELRMQTRTELGINDDQVVILFSGKLIPRKNPALIGEAVRKLNGSFVVLYLGDGPLHEVLANDTGVEQRFVGFQNQTELSRFYHAADLMVLPSNFETWGLVVNEALLHGLPVIASDQVGSAVDLVKERVTGSIFAVGDAQALAARIESWLGRVDDADVRDACRRLVADYSVDAAADGIARAYRAVI